MKILPDLEILENDQIVFKMSLQQIDGEHVLHIFRLRLQGVDTHEVQRIQVGNCQQDQNQVDQNIRRN